MKKNKLKPFLTGSVFILPALLLLTGNVQETKAMMKGAVGKVLGGIKPNQIKIPNITNGGVKVSSSALNAIKKNTTGGATITKPTTNNTTSSSLGLGNLKQNKFTIPNVTGGVTMSSNKGSIIEAVKKAGLTGTTTTGNKSATLPNTSTSTSSTSNLVTKSNSFSGTTATKRPAPQPPKSSSTLVDKVNATGITADTGLKPKRPAPPPPTSSNKLNSTNSDKPDPGYGTVPKPIFTPKDPNKPVSEPEQYENVVIVNTNAGTLTIFKDH